MTADFLPVAAFAVMAMLLAVSLREIKKEYAVILSVVCAVMLMVWGISSLYPVAAQLEDIISSVGMEGEYSEILLKALGISVCTQLACDACKDAGEGAIGSKIEFCGRACLLVMSMPLLGEILALARKILSN